MIYVEHKDGKCSAAAKGTFAEILTEHAVLIETVAAGVKKNNIPTNELESALLISMALGLGVHKGGVEEVIDKALTEKFIATARERFAVFDKLAEECHE